MLVRIALAAVVLAMGALPARAADPQALSDAEIQRRLAFLEERLDASRTRGMWWHWGWLTLQGGNAIAQTAVASSTGSADTRANAIVEAVKSSIGVAEKFLRPLEARHGADPVRELPGATRADRVRRLEVAEALLRSNAERSEERWDWRAHAGNLLVNAIGGVVVGLTGETGTAAISAGMGLLGGTAQIFTEPSRPAGDLEDYERFTAGTAARDEWSWSLVSTGTGLGIRVDF